MQLPPGATPEPHVLAETVKAADPVPVTDVETVSDGIVPTFLTVTGRVFAVPCVMVPKLRLVGDTDTSVVAVPLSGITGLDPPLVVSVRVPLLLPTAVGAYFTVSVQFAPAARLLVQVLLEIEKPVPEIAEAKVKATVPALVMVSGEVLLVPKEIDPKAIDEADSFTSVPLPVT